MSTDQHERSRPPSPEEGPERHEPPKSSLSIAQVVGGALAAMTAAALGSRLSVAGTVVGAALASVVAAVGGAVYTASLRRTSKHVGAVITRVRPASSGSTRTEAAGAPVADPGAPRATGPSTTVDPSPGWALPGAPQPPTTPTAPTAPTDDRRSRIRWKPVVVTAVLMFVIAALALTGLELATGRALSGGTGTTVGQVAEPSTRPSARPTERPSPTPSARPTTTTSAVPSATPSSTPSSPPSAEPSTSASAAPSTSATPTPAATPTPTAEAVPSGATPAS